jgi:hypothetical protein
LPPPPEPTPKVSVPRAALQQTVKQYLPSIFDCFKKQLRRDSRFTGVRVQFTIRGDRGKVGYVGFEDADKPYRRLKRCIKRNTWRWRFPRFNGSAMIVYPIYIKSS